MKHSLVLIFLVVQFVQAQKHTVKGVFIDSLHNVKNVALYKLDNGETNYLKYAKVEKDTFKLAMDSLATGHYRALYKNVKTGYVDFIYDKESVFFTVHSKVGQESVSYLESRENQLLDSYYYNLAKLQHKLDSVQMSYFTKPNSNAVKEYQEIQSKIKGAQNYYEDLAKEDYCLGEIKASKIYNAPLPFDLPGDYVESVTNHFFDFIDFSDERLRNASLLIDKISEYIFYLHQSDDVMVQNKNFVIAIKKVLTYTKENLLKELILRYLIQQFVAKENTQVLAEALSMYKDLPKETQRISFIKETEMFAKVMLGVKAPNIKITGENTLYDLQKTNKYLVVFWSSTCSHCLKELPEVEKLLANNLDITVVAVGLEKKEGKDHWVLESGKFKKWQHVIALGKWNSKEALEYNIHATPSYFLLNKDKIIVAKPDNVNELEMLLKK